MAMLKASLKVGGSRASDHVKPADSSGKMESGDAAVAASGGQGQQEQGFMESLRELSKGRMLRAETVDSGSDDEVHDFAKRFLLIAFPLPVRVTVAHSLSLHVAYCSLKDRAAVACLLGRSCWRWQGCRASPLPEVAAPLSKHG